MIDNLNFVTPSAAFCHEIYTYFISIGHSILLLLKLNVTITFVLLRVVCNFSASNEFNNAAFFYLIKSSDFRFVFFQYSTQFYMQYINISICNICLA